MSVALKALTVKTTVNGQVGGRQKREWDPRSAEEEVSSEKSTFSLNNNFSLSKAKDVPNDETEEEEEEEDEVPGASTEGTSSRTPKKNKGLAELLLMAPNAADIDQGMAAAMKKKKEARKAKKGSPNAMRGLMSKLVSYMRENRFSYSLLVSYTRENKFLISLLVSYTRENKFPTSLFFSYTRKNKFPNSRTIKDQNICTIRLPHGVICLQTCFIHEGK
jgi:hypothetical protein